MSLLQFGIHGDVGAQQSRNEAARFGANGRINEFALRHVGQTGDNVQVNVHYRPTRGQMFQRHGCGGNDVAGSRTGQSQCIRQGQGKAARMGGGNQFGGIGGKALFEGNTRAIAGLFQDAAPGAYDSGAAFGSAFPPDRGLPDDQFHQDILP